LHKKTLSLFLSHQYILRGFILVARKPIMHPDDDLHAKLKFLLNFYQTAGRMRTCKIVADHLRSHLSPQPTWGAAYIHMASNERITISEKLGLAIRLEFFSVRQDMSDIELETVQILAPIGLIKPGTICIEEPRICLRCKQQYFSSYSVDGICPICQSKDNHKQFVYKGAPEMVDGILEPVTILDQAEAATISGCWVPDTTLTK
jgi:hypothetical protein